MPGQDVIVASLALAAGVFTILVGAFVLVTRSDRSQNRRLASVLWVHGLMIGSWWGIGPFVASEGIARTLLFFSLVCAIGLGPLYLDFVATVRSRWSDLLGRRRTRRLLIAVAGLLIAPVLLWPTRFVITMRPAAIGWEVTFGPWMLPVVQVVGLMLLVTLVVSIQAWRQAAPDSQERRKTGAFVVAFASSDAHWMLFLFLLLPLYIFRPSHDLALLTAITPAVSTFIYVTLIAYGILRTQMFDIELRIKRNIGRTVVVGILVVGYFVASEATENLLSDRYGFAAGLATALVLAALFGTIRRLGRRVADAAMPDVGSDAHIQRRKHEVYRAAVESAVEDGVISERERGFLDVLRGNLGLSHDEARAVEAAAGR